jgi:hypothetical protein
MLVVVVHQHGAPPLSQHAVSDLIEMVKRDLVVAHTLLQHLVQILGGVFLKNFTVRVSRRHVVQDIGALRAGKIDVVHVIVDLPID